MEKHNEFFAGVVAGVLTVLFLQISTVLLGLRKIVEKKSHPDTYHRDILEDPPEAVVKILAVATKECADLAWLNITIQRLFCEISKSSMFSEKIKETLVNKLSIAFSSGILKRVTFKDFCFGSEAPYVKKIRAMSENEVKEFLEKKEQTEITGGQDRPAMYKQVYLLIDIEYTTSDNCFYVDADLIKGYSIPIMVKMQPFRGQVVVRMPANNYSTRFEICFANNPGFDFSVEAAFSKNDSVFFSSSVSLVLKRVFKYITKMYIYPNWYYYYLPVVVSKSKVIVYPYFPISENSTDGAKLQMHEVQNLLSLDYNIITKKENIIFRKTKSTVNSSDTPLERAEIEIKPEHLQRISEVMRSSEKFDPFEEVISNYEGSKTVEKYSDNVTRMHLLIAGEVYEFLRIVSEDLVLYQHTDPTEPQFIAIKREGRFVVVLQYTVEDSAFRLGRFRITKLAKKLEEQEMKMLGSTSLFRIFDTSAKQIEKIAKIFKKTKDRERARESATKDFSKMQYVTNGHALDSSTMAQTNVSEVSIMESHLRSIETKLVRENSLPDLEISFPFSKELIKEAMGSSIVRACILGHFAIMDDIELTETLRNTSMVSTTGQYVQLLSYCSQDSEFVIEQVLLSKELYGITVAIKACEQKVEMFVYGRFSVNRIEFESLVHSFVTKTRCLKGVPYEVPRVFLSTSSNTAGVAVLPCPGTLCSFKVEKGDYSFVGDALLDKPLVISLGSQDVPLKIFLKSNNKKKPLSVCTLPNSEFNGFFHMEGKFLVKKKQKISIPVSRGVVYWSSPWVAPDKTKPEEQETINGAGYAVSEDQTPLVWTNKAGKDSAVTLFAGSLLLR